MYVPTIPHTEIRIDQNSERSTPERKISDLPCGPRLTLSNRGVSATVTAMGRRLFAHVAILIAAAPVAASPNVSLDDPVYDDLDQRVLAGELPLYRGGLEPLTEARVAEVLGRPSTLPDGWWVAPIERAALYAAVVHETDRTYSTPARPRDVAGVLALSCEYQEGRPCGDGQGLSGELDAAAGYSDWISGGVRLRLRTGRDQYTTGVDLDRAYVNAELGPIAAEVGRDVLVIGPTVRTVVGWGANAPPLDQLRLSGVRPLALTSWLRLNVVYVLGRLADPQTYPGDLVSLTRAQLDFADRVELGAMQLLQLAGQGAPGFGFVDFILEHVRRRDASASYSDSSNRRIGFDVAVRIPELGARVTYQMMLEDLRTEVISAFRYDADHFVGFATRWGSIEIRKTGERSYEHFPRVTGFTTGGRIVGDPLGPAALAAYIDAKLPWATNLVVPWIEVARLGSDTFSFGDGPIVRTSAGETELHFRAGVRVRVPINHELEVDPEAAIEDVERFAFVPGAQRTNALVRATLVWRPDTMMH